MRLKSAPREAVDYIEKNGKGLTGFMRDNDPTRFSRYSFRKESDDYVLIVGALMRPWSLMSILIRHHNGAHIIIKLC
jgi:hypothetical protein